MGDGVLMNSLQLARRRLTGGTSHSPCSTRGRPRSTPSIRLFEPVKRDRVQSSDAPLGPGARSLRSEGFGSVRVVQGFGHDPSIRPTLEEDGLTVVPRGDEGCLAQETKRRVREGDRSDDLNRGGGFARSGRVDDGYRSVVA